MFQKFFQSSPPSPHFSSLQVIRATSKSPYGPYKKAQLILPTFAHDANIVRAPTGEFVLFVTALRGVKPSDCRRYEKGDKEQEEHDAMNSIDGNGFAQKARGRTLIVDPTLENETEDGDDVPPKDTSMLWAPKPEGPWSEPVMVLNSTIYNSDYWKKYNTTAKCDSNLNGIILPSPNKDGKQPFLGLWRRCETEDLLTIPHALVASDWRNASTYKPIVDHPLFVLAGSGAEDPSNIWTTTTSDLEESNKVAYHAIFHDEQATRCMLGRCGGQGRHAVSLDGTNWRYASVNAYERHFWEVSSEAAAETTTPNPNERTGVVPSKRFVTADTRARPHIILSPVAKGQNPLQQRPIALSTGLKETDESGYVYTLVQPMKGHGDGTSRDHR